jgi:hypothetical protein
MLPPTHCPNSWNDVSVSLWQEFKEICSKEWESDIEFQIEVISLFWDVSPDDPFFNEITHNELLGHYKNFEWLGSTIHQPPKEEIEIDGVTYFLKEFHTITLGEYIDMVEFLKRGEDNLGVICACLWRKCKKDEWDNLKYEPYTFDVNKRSESFKNIPITWCYGIIEKYVAWMDDVAKAHTSLFEPEGWDQIDGEDQLDPQEAAQIKKEIETEKKLAPFSWLRIVWDLSSQDISKFDAVFNTPVILAFNTLSMRKALKI